MAMPEWGLEKNFLRWELRNCDIEPDLKPKHQAEPNTQTKTVTKSSIRLTSQVHKRKDIYYPGWAVEKWS